MLADMHAAVHISTTEIDYAHGVRLASYTIAILDQQVHTLTKLKYIYFLAFRMKL